MLDSQINNLLEDTVMNRLLIALFCLLITVPAGAQPNRNIGVNFDDIAVSTAVAGLAAAEGYRIIGALPTKRFSMKTETSQPLEKVLAHILNPLGYNLIMNDSEKTITVFQEVQPTDEAPRGMTQAQRGAVEQLLQRYPGAYEPDGTIGSFNQLFELQREAYYRSQPPPRSYGPYRDYQYNGFYGEQYYPLYWKGCEKGPSGKVKFKYVGLPNERILWEVSFNGDIIGSLDQADSFFNETTFCAGSVVVKALKRGAGELERRYSIRPGELTEITIGDFLFPKKND